MGARTVTEKDGVTVAPATADAAGPGLLLLWSVNEPLFSALPIAGDHLELGRDQLLSSGVHDARISRRHVRIDVKDDVITLRELGSTNGSFVDGKPLLKQLTIPLWEPAPTGCAPAEPACVHVLRIGRTVLIPVADVAPYQRDGLSVHSGSGLVSGPLLQRLHARIALLARAGENVLLTGPSGAGKELAAHSYHAATGRPQAPMVAINCATIPRDLAESLLFGARRGAYSGAVADSDGLIVSAHGGTLFLDEIGELEASIQAKLLRVLETREVLAVGAIRPRMVDIRLCAATLMDLDDAVASGRFRQDLYFRIGRPSIRIPALQQRPEEIPTLIEQSLRSVSQRAVTADGAAVGSTPLQASAALVEQCLLRRWPGNVRELRTEIRAAGLAALSAGRCEVDVGDLDVAAGRTRSAEPAAEPSSSQISEALRTTGGNLTAAADKLHLPRTTLRRLLERHGIDLLTFRRSQS